MKKKKKKEETQLSSNSDQLRTNGKIYISVATAHRFARPQHRSMYKKSHDMKEDDDDDACAIHLPRSLDQRSFSLLCKGLLFLRRNHRFKEPARCVTLPPWRALVGVVDTRTHVRARNSGSLLTISPYLRSPELPFRLFLRPSVRSPPLFAESISLSLSLSSLATNLSDM